LTRFLTGVLGAILLSAPAGASLAMDDEPSNVSSPASHCLRNRVVWSGGIALRGPNRLHPAPVRSKWQTRDESRLRCPLSATSTKIRHRAASTRRVR
jgi:hypothetical protein